MRTFLALSVVLLVATGSAAGEGSERMGLPPAEDLSARPGIGEALARGLRDGAPARVVVEARVFRLPEDVGVRRLGGPPKDVVRGIHEDVARGLLREVGTGRCQQLHHFTSLPLAEGQAASFRASAATTYMQDYDVEVPGMVMEVTDPIVGALEEGVLIQVERGPEATLKVQVDGAFVRRPVSSFDAALHGRTVRIQLPELRIVRAEGRAPVAVGGWLLTGSRLIDDDGSRDLLLVLLHVRAPRR